MDKYDFIIVGGGASGCTLAWRLANSRAKPSVLLIEAGGANDDVSHRVDGDRWIQRLDTSMNWGFKTTPQEHMDNRCIDYDRGKGLGGSTAINFCVYTVGPRDDWDEIARLTGDQDFSWDSVSQSFKRFETFHYDPARLPGNAASYLKPDVSARGSSGPLQIGFAKNWEPAVSGMLDVCQDAGHQLCYDMNSGDPIGVGVSASTATQGVRRTAAEFVKDPPANLTILTNTPVNKLVFDNNKCVGVEIAGATSPLFARNEVIVSSGSLDSPKILLHSGIGPAEQLERFGIERHVNLPGVGKTLRDHPTLFISWEKKADTSNPRRDYYSSQSKQDIGRAQWNKDHTGPLADLLTTIVLGWLKSSAIESSPEFAALPQSQQEHLKRPTIPHYELALNPADVEYFIDPANAPPQTTIGILPQNPQSTGTVELQSSDPRVPLLFNPNFLEHPFDRRVAIEGVREAMKIASQPSFAKDIVGLRNGPKSDSDEDILSFWRANGITTWHMCGTLRMGKKEDVEDGVCVDSDFRVLGTEKLRVVDMSVVPLLVSAHTQASAYCLGLVASDKIAKEYGLD